MTLSAPQIQPKDEDAAQYISLMARELRAMAAKANLGFLTYLLAMVEDEASASVGKQTDAQKGS